MGSGSLLDGGKDLRDELPFHHGTAEDVARASERLTIFGFSGCVHGDRCSVFVDRCDCGSANSNCLLHSEYCFLEEHSIQYRHSLYSE